MCEKVSNSKKKKKRTEGRRVRRTSDSFLNRTFCTYRLLLLTKCNRFPILMTHLYSLSLSLSLDAFQNIFQDFLSKTPFLFFQEHMILCVSKRSVRKSEHLALWCSLLFVCEREIGKSCNNRKIKMLLSCVLCVYVVVCVEGGNPCCCWNSIYKIHWEKGLKKLLSVKWRKLDFWEWCGEPEPK